LIPSIVLVEIVYICEKKGILPAGGAPFLNLLADSTNYRVDPLDLQTLSAMRGIPRGTITDMPDRIIVATSLKLGLPLITADVIIRDSGLVSVVW
jgi:PIN domain nuclease of toxin-antitoxin system